ncbi:hypothetical protein FO519_006069 [Halicephalobus sp. NKZ332]|nr:hypothetical protein FO519_006069 [Halicephalobus sp. NKZ332]
MMWRMLLVLLLQSSLVSSLSIFSNYGSQSVKFGYILSFHVTNKGEMQCFYEELKPNSVIKATLSLLAYLPTEIEKVAQERHDVVNTHQIVRDKINNLVTKIYRLVFYQRQRAETTIKDEMMQVSNGNYVYYFSLIQIGVIVTVGVVQTTFEMNFFKFGILVILSYGYCKEQLDENVFDSVLIENFKTQWEFLSPHERRTVLSKLGKLAFYMRLYRSWIITPNGKKGFIDRFPEPRVPVNREIFKICGKLLKTCVDSLYSSIQERTQFLFPKRNQEMKDFVLDEEQFRNLVADSMFAFDVSVSYLLCFFTNNRLEFMKHLPFCSYGIEKGQKKTWPSDTFRDFVNNPLYPLTNDFIQDPINTLDTRDFVCAEESFCPDPCCNRTSGREKLCLHEICKEEDFRRQKSPGKSTLEIHSCKLNDVFNDDFIGLTRNQWNVSCSCSNSGFIFRFDILRCVDVDECKLGQDCSVENEECVNTIGGYSCECLLGFVRLEDDLCHQLEIDNLVENDVDSLLKISESL